MRTAPVRFAAQRAQLQPSPANSQLLVPTRRRRTAGGTAAAARPPPSAIESGGSAGVGNGDGRRGRGGKDVR
eukprot:3582941-Rhodomonas_salina.2